MRWMLLGLGWLIVLAAFVSYTLYIVKIWISPPVVQIASFRIGDEPAENIASYLVARANEIAGPLPLEFLHEVEVPAITNNIGSEGKSPLGDVKLQIGGVDVPALLRALSAFVPTTHHSVTGFAVFELSNPLLQLEWRQPDSSIRKSWVLTLDRAADNKLAVKLLLDQALYRLFYYMHHDPKGPDEWRKSSIGCVSKRGGFRGLLRRQEESRFLPPVFQVLRAGSSGAAISIASTGDAAVRGRADAVGSHAVGKAGEVEAISVYNEAISAYEPTGEAFKSADVALKKAEDTLKKSAAQTKEERQRATSALEEARKAWKDVFQKHVLAQKMLQQAQLFKATALRKRYRWQHSHEALSTLQTLEGNVTALLALPGLSDLDRKDFSKIRLGALIEKSYSLGQYLNLLNPPNFVSALTGSETPDAVNPPDDLRDKLLSLKKTGHDGDAAYVAKRNEFFWRHSMQSTNGT